MAFKKFLNKFFIFFILSTIFINSLTPSYGICSKDFHYIKNSKKPEYLYVIDQNNMTSAENVMISTLQGLVSNYSTSQIYTLNSSEPDYAIWLEDLKNNYAVKYEVVKDPWELLDKFKSYVDGYILYSNKTKNDPSINNACSLASLKKSLVVEESLEDKVKSYGITKLQGDCRNTDKYWAYNNLWNSGLNHSIVIQLSPDKSAPLRDYAIMAKCLVFFEETSEDLPLSNKVFSSMDKNSICLGWGSDEYNNVMTASKHGVSLVAADWSYNLTVLSGFPSMPLNQKESPSPLTEDDVHYVTFIMSDGDNQQWNLGNNFSSQKWYDSPHKGSFNMGWSITPSMYYLSPTVLNLYYKNANKDYFIVSPSGNGYMFPSKFPNITLDYFVKNLNDYMGKVDQKYVAIIDDNAFLKVSIWDKYTKECNIKGLFYLNYKKHNDYCGEIIWSNDKPVVSCRDILWDGLEDEDMLVAEINKRIDLGYTDIHNKNSYSFVYVHAWSKDMNSIKNVVTKLSKNPKVRIVTPDGFMTLINKNLKKE
ncbi:MAG: protein phosphatase [Clostridium argentinense]|uniref:Protein phosphatase n=1 Tax=Clostridium faecium TaxID=2762223 RepID=A0ABR8YU60_9CLOT|nr:MULTISPECIES: GxGYxYP domain-containing protein [Clostridium]MBD8047807.1 protein phosphatase [Clostridium faecium]MBS5822846.1 protein phosphatase [Clostridium argentinense]MDU1349713.1 GxGYxYP family putative glycoside hydrolase [Clostridium argentinense]